MNTLDIPILLSIFVTVTLCELKYTVGMFKNIQTDFWFEDVNVPRKVDDKIVIWFILFKKDDTITLKQEAELPLLRKFKKLFKIFKPKKEDTTDTFASNISSSYDRTYRNAFFGIDDKQTVTWLFSNPTRCLLVSNIIHKIQLKNQFVQANGSLKSLEESNQSQLDYQLSKGLQFMLGEKYFEELFILHDETKHQVLLLQLMEHSDLLFKDSEDINRVISKKIRRGSQSISWLLS